MINSPQDYDITLPWGASFFINQQVIDKFRQLAFDLDLTQEQVTALVNFLIEEHSQL